MSQAEKCPKCEHLSVAFDFRLGRKRCYMVTPYCGWVGEKPLALEERVRKLEPAAREEGT